MGIQGSEYKLDHVAFIDHEPLVHNDFFLDELQVEFVPGPQDEPGFNAHQWRFLNDMKLEFLQPARTDINPFAQQFLDRHGAGVHHLTFQVPDLNETMKVAERMGFPILYANTEYEGWKEAFIHPKYAFGTVVQLAEFPEYRPESKTLNPSSASLHAIELRVHDVERAQEFFTQVLHGTQDNGAPLRVIWEGPVHIDLRPVAAEVRQGIEQIEIRGSAFPTEVTRNDLAFAPGLNFTFSPHVTSVH